ncbi:hypothetical protein COO60DRAFT_1457488, partial [Scenedesmus sp. NREL 46B-D3]
MAGDSGDEEEEEDWLDAEDAEQQEEDDYQDVEQAEELSSITDPDSIPKFASKVLEYQKRGNEGITPGSPLTVYGACYIVLRLMQGSFMRRTAVSKWCKWEAHKKDECEHGKRFVKNSITGKWEPAM